jgi:transposase
VGRPKTSTDDIATMAFWRIHVNGWLRSELSIKEYCEVYELSKVTFLRWRQAVKEDDAIIERKALRRSWHHGKRKVRADSAPATGLATAPVVPAKKGRRRYFAEDIKRRIVEETCQPGMSVSEVARRYNVSTNLIFGWRAELGLRARREAKFLPVQIMDAGEEGAQALRFEAPNAPPGASGEQPRAAIEVELLSGRRVRFDGGIEPETMRRLILALEGNAP